MITEQEIEKLAQGAVDEKTWDRYDATHKFYKEGVAYGLRKAQEIYKEALDKGAEWDKLDKEIAEKKIKTPDSK